MLFFISATSKDLKRFRDIACNQVRRMGEDAFLQEEISADCETLPNILKEEIVKCSAVICLVGKVFGDCPKNQQRSWTQIEYDTAQEYKKQTILLFPSDKCDIENIEEKPGYKERQERYRSSLRESEHKWDEFDGEEHLRRLVAEAVNKVRERHSGTKLAQQVKEHFPTPLATLFDECFGEDGTLLQSFVAESLRLVTLLAVQDSVVHRVFGRESSERAAKAGLLAEPLQLGDWYELLHLACPTQRAGMPARFIMEFAGWSRTHFEALKRLVNTHQRWLKGVRNKSARSELVSDFKEQLTVLYNGLQFLYHYVLIAVVDVNQTDRGQQCAVRILRGLQPAAVELVGDGREFRPEKNGLYLLNLDRANALRLNPALWYFSEWNTDDIFGWSRMHLDEDNRDPLAIELGAFCDDESPVILPDAKRETGSAFAGEEVPRGAPQDLAQMMTDWLGGDLAFEAFAVRGSERQTNWTGKLFDDESWEMLKKTVLPQQPVGMVLGNGVITTGAALHPGKHVDRFEAVCAPKTVNDKPLALCPLAHVLRQETAEPELVRAWFSRRAECWKRIEHESVLPLFPQSDPTAEKRPFLVTERVAGGRTLERVCAWQGPLGDDQVCGVLKLAAEVCRIAEGQNVRIMAFPLRHFLEDDLGKLWLTGFDAALANDEDLWLGLEPHTKYFRMFTKDADMIAPEVSKNISFPARSADVFALGILLAVLKRLPQQAMESLPLADWLDPWKCLAFHCLAVNPQMRFQSSAQFLHFLNEWLDRGHDALPQVVEVPAGSVTMHLNGQRQTTSLERLFISKYPVTNAEFYRFCRETHRGYPRHQLFSLRNDNDFFDRLRREQLRLVGPWCPVTHVSLEDAEDYCRWLGDRSGTRRWRLPTEAEWQRAAALDSDCLYPWGDEAPSTLHANFGRSWRGPTVVGSFQGGISRTGCWDLGGNVWEWCSDYASRERPQRVQKGGAYDFGANALRVTARREALLRETSPHVGFRVICEELP